VRRFVLPPSWDGGPVCLLPAADVRRLVQVLRLQPGNSFPAMAADGSLYTCILEKSGKHDYAVRVAPEQPGTAGHDLADIRAGRLNESGQKSGATGSPLAIPQPNTLPVISLALGLLKGSKLDEVVRMATEAGVHSIIPLACERSVVQAESGFRRERLDRIVREALGQSGSSVPTRLEAVTSPADLVRRFGNSSSTPANLAETTSVSAEAHTALRLVFHEQPLAAQALHQYCGVGCSEILACVGPEGGFSGQELDGFLSGGFLPAWLGPTVLRAESAAIFALASLRIICLERFSWINKE
jgi:RsmE family RNA methyltransferase